MIVLDIPAAMVCDFSDENGTKCTISIPIPLSLLANGGFGPAISKELRATGWQLIANPALGPMQPFTCRCPDHHRSVDTAMHKVLAGKPEEKPRIITSKA